MTEVVVPATTFWDVAANALDDPWFWAISAVTAFGTALIIRSRLTRCLRWCSLRSSRRRSRPWPGSG